MKNIQWEIFDSILWIKIVGEFDGNQSLKLEGLDYNEIVIDFSNCSKIREGFFDFLSYFLKLDKKIYFCSLSDNIFKFIDELRIINTIPKFEDFYQVYDFIINDRVLSFKDKYLEFRKKFGFLRKIGNVYYTLFKTTLVIFPEEEVTMENVDNINEVLKDNKAYFILISFKFLKYIDSTGMGQLIVIYRELKERLIITDIPDVINNVFKKVRFHDYMNIFPTIGSGLREIFSDRKGFQKQVNIIKKDNDIILKADEILELHDLLILENIFKAENYKKVILDLEKTRYISSVVLGKIIALHGILRNRLYVKNVSNEIMRIFEIVNIDSLLNISCKIENVDLSSNLDGMFTLINKKEGYFLSVYPPKGNGRPVEFSDVLKAIRDRGILVYDEEIIKYIVESAKCESIKIEENKMNLDALIIDKSLDEMRAFLLIKNDADPFPTYADAYYFLLKNMIIINIKKGLLEEIIKNKITNKPVLIAEGAPPIKGKDAEIQLKISLDYVKKPMLKDGKIDFKEISNFLYVKKDTILAVKKPRIPSKPGITVTGKVVEVEESKDIDFEMGENTYVDEDGLTLRSAIDGVVEFDGDVIYVKNVLEINSDINYEVGNIHYKGAVIVNGDIKDGFLVEGNKILVNGFLEGGNIICHNGDVIVKNGIIGLNKGKIIVESGNLYTKYIKDAQVYVRGSIFIDNGEIRNSTVVADGDIILNGIKGNIIGGEVSAGGIIEVFNISNSLSIKTIIRMENNALKNIRSKLKKYYHDLEKLKKKKDEYLYQLSNLWFDLKKFMENNENLNFLNEIIRLSNEIDNTSNYISEYEEILSSSSDKLKCIISDLKEEINNLKDSIGKKGGFLNVDTMERLLETSIYDKNKLLEKIEVIYEKRQKLSELEKKLKLLESLFIFRDKTKVIIKGSIFPGGIVIYEGIEELNIDRVYTNCKIRYKDNKLVVK